MNHSPYPHPMYNECLKHMNKAVNLKTVDGKEYEGIIEYVDEQHVILMITISHEDENRFGFGYPYAYPGFYPPYPYGPGYYGRLILPLTALAALSLLW